MSWQHPVRARLSAGLPVIAATITCTSLDMAAHIAASGFHFLWVEMEHSPITLETLRGIVLATRGLPATVFARVPVNEIWTAKRVMDQGVTGVIFPFTSTPELARQAAAACRYPPLGRRGSGAGLASATWPEPGSYYDSADRNMVTVALIEEASAVEHVEAIAETPGIDVIFIGTSDLSFSYGFRGRQDEPVLHAAIDRILRAAQRAGKWAGRPAGTAAEVKQYTEQGFLFFQSVTELGLVTSGTKQLLEPLGLSGIPNENRSLY